MRWRSHGLHGHHVPHRIIDDIMEKYGACIVNLTNFAPQTDATTFALSFNSILLLGRGVIVLADFIFSFMPDIEPVYMSEKNSNHVKEIDDI